MNSITSIAISSQNNTGKTTLSSVLSERLQWKHIRIGEEFRKLANEYNLDIEKFGSIPDEKLILIDEIMKKRMSIEEKKIWDGRLSCFLARGRKDILKVFCTADLNVRIIRASIRSNIDHDTAKKQILDREIEEKKVFHRLYHLDNPYDKKWIDLILNTSTNSPSELAQIVIENINLSKRSL